MSDRRRRLVKNAYVDIQQVERYERTNSLFRSGDMSDYSTWHHGVRGLQQLVVALKGD